MSNRYCWSLQLPGLPSPPLPLLTSSLSLALQGCHRYPGLGTCPWFPPRLSLCLLVQEQNAHMPVRTDTGTHNTEEQCWH